MTWDRYRRILDEISDYATFVCLYNWGEPFMHSRIYDMIDYAKQRCIYVKISTNTHPFRVQDAERLVRTRLDELVISLHGASEESYRHYQPEHSLREVLDKTNAIVQEKVRQKSTLPKIHFGFIVIRSNEHEIEKLKAISREMRVDYFLNRVSLHLRYLPYGLDMRHRQVDEDRLRAERMERIRAWLPSDDRYVAEWYRHVQSHDGALPPCDWWRSCTDPWYLTVISWNGDVNLCPGSYEHRHSVGNVFEQPLAVIWNNALYRSARATIRSKSAGPRTVLCQECRGSLL